MHQPHDKLFKKIFSSKKAVRKFIRHFLPRKLIAKIDFRTLQYENVTFIDESLKAFSSDAVYSVKIKGRLTYLSLLFEHKSYVTNPYPQLLKYIGSGYYAQDEDTDEFIPIIPIVLFHGEGNWKQQSFSDYFDLQDSSLKVYIPDFEYHLVDLADYSDEMIFSVGLDILTSMLLLFKHKNDKEFVIRHSRKIFIFEGEKEFEENKSYHLAIINYTFVTFRFEDEEIKIVVNQLPKPSKKLIMNTYERLLNEGEQIGLTKGEQIGLTKGEQIGVKNTTLESALTLIIKFPSWTNELIAEVSKLDFRYVKEIRTLFRTQKTQMLKSFVLELMKDIPNLKEDEIQKTENLLLKAYNQFQNLN